MRAVIENDQPSWANDLIQLPHQMNEAVQVATALGQNQLTPQQITELESKYDKIIQAGLAQNPLPSPSENKKRGRVKKSKIRNLLERLNQKREAVFLFFHDFKVHQKVSGTFRSTNGAKIFCRIRGFISTMKKQGMPVLENIQQAIRGNPFLPTSKSSYALSLGSFQGYFVPLVCVDCIY